MGVDLGVKVGLNSALKEFSPKNPEVVELNVLVGLLLIVMIPLSDVVALLLYAIVPLRVKSLSDLLGVTKLCERFFW